MKDSQTSMTPIPTRWIGPMRISGNVVNEVVSVPLATYESPLWKSCGRGARLSMQIEQGIQVTVMQSCMTRSILLEAINAHSAFTVSKRILDDKELLDTIVSGTSRFTQLLAIHPEIVGNLLFLRLTFSTGDASGHNMATKAADALIQHFLSVYPTLRYGSISGNYCADKKASAINGILGRGHRVVAEITIPSEICTRLLRTRPEAITTLNLHKNYIGSQLAGSIRSANAHFANMLLATYLATGQDAANIVEGSQGLVHTKLCNDALYFSCTLPNIIVGTIGNGKGEKLTVVEENLQRLGCREISSSVGENSKRLAAIIAATVLCGELSLLAAQTNPRELVRTHLTLERCHD